MDKPSDLMGLVIPTHMSQKARQNRSWAPPTLGWVSKTLEGLHTRVPATQGMQTWVVVNSHPGRPGNDEYLRNLTIWCATNRLCLHIDESPGYRGVRCNLADWFPQKYLFLVEHDWEFLEDISLEAVLRVFEENEQVVNYMRFNKRPNTVFPKLTATRREGAEIYCYEVELSDMQLCASPHYTNNPHIERVSKYKEWAAIARRRSVHAGANMGAGGFEHPLQEESLDDYEKLGRHERDAKWGTFIYGGLNHPAVVSHFGV